MIASTAFKGDECAGGLSELPSHVLLGDSGHHMCPAAAALGGAVLYRALTGSCGLDVEGSTALPSLPSLWC